MCSQFFDLYLKLSSLFILCGKVGQLLFNLYYVFSGTTTSASTTGSCLLHVYNVSKQGNYCYIYVAFLGVLLHLVQLVVVFFIHVSKQDNYGVVYNDFVSFQVTTTIKTKGRRSDRIEEYVQPNRHSNLQTLKNMKTLKTRLKPDDIHWST